MNLLAIGCSYHTSPVEVRERLAFNSDQLPLALEALTVRFDCEAVILSTCNRVELYLARVPEQVSETPSAPLDGQAVAAFLADFHGLTVDQVTPHLYTKQQAEAVHHLFHVAASLDSLIIGEGQIAGQVKTAYEKAQEYAAIGPLLHALFQHARQVARRVRTETGIARGHVSVSSAAVDYVRQVFDHFGDKTILVIGAGKMGELTLRHLRSLEPRRILVTNRSPDKALAVAQGCGGEAVAWEKLDDVLPRADIILSTTGAPEPIVTAARWQRLAHNRTGGPVVILDIAVPRDFDPNIHDGDRTCLFNIDDLKRTRDATLADRRKHVPPAEAIVTHEANRFLIDWKRRRHGPVIERLTKDLEAKRAHIVQNLLRRLNGRLTDADRREIEGAFRLLQNQILHGPISALAAEANTEQGPSLLAAMRKLFRLND
jgi:glutamyl-tRNA reductase